MTDRQRYSVILPVRNGGEYLKDCVASILAQTLADQFEFLVLENASTDGTAEWLETLCDPRVHVYPSKRPLSIEENWTRILQVPRGEFTTIIGHDDLLDPNYLEVMQTLIDEHPDAGLYFAHFRLIDTNGTILRSCLPMPGHETAAEFLAARIMKIRDSFGTGYLMRSIDYDRVGGIPPFGQLMHADDALWMLLMENSWKATSPYELFSYRLHAQSTSGSNDPLAYLRALESYQDVLEKLSEQDHSVREVITRYGPDYYFEHGESLHKRLLIRSLIGQQGYPQDAPKRLHRIAQRFTGWERSNQRRKKRLKLLEYLHRMPGGRSLYWVIHTLARFARQQHRLRS